MKKYVRIKKGKVEIYRMKAEKTGGETNMCKKLKELHGLSAETLLEKVGQSNVVPIDVAQICYDLNIWVKSFDFSVIEKNDIIKNQVAENGSILGAVLVKDDDLAILYSLDDTSNRKRFTLAHELAHCCLHMNPDEKIHIEFRNENNLDKKEVEANTFAGELLIPEKTLKRLIENTNRISRKTMLLLSEMFLVSVNVMQARLKTLNIEVVDL